MFGQLHREKKLRIFKTLQYKFGVKEIRFDTPTYIRFFFDKKSNYISLRDLQKVLTPHGLSIYGIDPEQRYLDVEVKN